MSQGSVEHLAVLMQDSIILDHTICCTSINHDWYPERNGTVSKDNYIDNSC